MELPEIMAALDATLIPPGREWDGRCPACGCATRSNRSGTGRRLCILCSEADAGEPADELAARVSRHLPRASYLKLPRDSDGRPVLPSLNYRAWRKLQR